MWNLEKSFTIQCHIPPIPITHSALATAAIHLSVFLLKVTLGFVFLLLQKFGSPVMEMPVGLLSPGLKEGGYCSGGGVDSWREGLIGKHCLQTLTSDLPINNQPEEMAPKNHTLVFSLQ